MRIVSFLRELLGGEETQPLLGNKSRATDLIIQEESDNLTNTNPTASSRLAEIISHEDKKQVDAIINDPKKDPTTISKFFNIDHSFLEDSIIQKILKCSCFDRSDPEKMREHQALMEKEILEKNADKVSILESIKKIGKSKRFRNFVTNIAIENYNTIKIEILTALTFDALVTEIMVALEYKGLPSNEQIAKARMLAQLIATYIVAINLMLRKLDNKELEEGILYHFVNVIGEFTFTLIVILYIIGLFQRGEMPNDAKSISELIGICSLAFAVGIMSYKEFRDKLYKIIEKKYGVNAPKLKIAINAIFEGISAASTMELIIFVMQALTTMIAPKKPSLVPTSFPMDLTRWALMGAYFSIRAGAEIKKPSDNVMDKIWKAEWALLAITGFLNQILVGLWVNQEFQADSDDEIFYEYGVIVAFTLMLLTQFGIICSKSYSAISSQENTEKQESRVEEIADLEEKEKEIEEENTNTENENSSTEEKNPSAARKKQPQDSELEITVVDEVESDKTFS